MSVEINIASIPIGLDRYINGTVLTVMNQFRDTDCGKWVYQVANDVYWQLDDDVENTGMILNIFAKFENEMDAVAFKLCFGNKCDTK